MADMARGGEKLCASRQADNHGDRKEFVEAKAEDHAARESSAQSHAQVYARTHLRALREGHKDAEGRHVSETELLIAHVLAAMKDCSLFCNDADKFSSSSSSSSAQMLKSAPIEALPQACAEVRTLPSLAWTSSAASRTQMATRTSSFQPHAATTTSSSSRTSSWVKGAAWKSSQAEADTRTSMPQAHIAAQTLSQACTAAAESSSQENKAALCIASLKHTHNKENNKPSNRTLDMQDERAKPKFRNVADLYKLSEH